MRLIFPCFLSAISIGVRFQKDEKRTQFLSTTLLELIHLTQLNATIQSCTLTTFDVRARDLINCNLQIYFDN